MADRVLIFDVGPVEPCGCQWQCWFEGDALHIGAACNHCQKEIASLLLKHWPELPVSEAE